MTANRAILDVPREVALYVGRLLKAQRRALGTLKGSRVLSCY